MAFAQDVALVFALLLGAAAAGCGSSEAPARSPLTVNHQGELSLDSATLSSGVASSGETVRDVRSIHRSRCGSCHVRVEPGARTKAQLESAFTRHHTRVKMNDAEWAGMVDYLASDSARAQASLVSAEK